MRGLTAERVDKIYSSYAPLYDRVFSKTFGPRVGRMVTELQIGPGDRVLELGFGTGLSLPYYPAGCSVVGIDLCGDMLREAYQERDRGVHERGYELELVEMDATRLAFADDSFDIVFGCFLATVVDDAPRLVEEMLRVVKPGGKAALVNHFRSENPVVGRSVQLLNPITKRLGWRTDLKLSWLEANSPMRVTRRFKMHTKVPDLFTFVFFEHEAAS